MRDHPDCVRTPATTNQAPLDLLVTTTQSPFGPRLGQDFHIVSGLVDLEDWDLVPPRVLGNSVAPIKNNISAGAAQHESVEDLRTCSWPF